MSKKKRAAKPKEVRDYRHSTATRKNNPPAGIAAQGKIQEPPKRQYAYNPHLPPRLRSDPDADKLPELLHTAQQRPLSADEAKTLAEALRHHAPWLEWTGKQENAAFSVDPVALHIHERISSKAILKTAKRQNVQRELFADPQQDYSAAVDFYQHDVDWANRLILGDSLTVMSSLAQRENLGGKVQMIYIDPPYGIKFASNFQPNVFQRDVKERSQDLTREREQIKAYRDTWRLGIHSYLAYLRDRLIVAKELLTDSGSVFVQIGDENVHRVRCIMDEVFGSEKLVAQICFKTTSGRQAKKIDRLGNYILWFAKDIENVKYHNLFVRKDNTNKSGIQKGDLQSQGESNTGAYTVEFNGKKYQPRPGRHWATTDEGMYRLIRADRIFATDNNIMYKRLASDYPVARVPDVWTDLSGGAADKMYVVQTNNKIVARCLLMTTDPGDLVLDPTCGSGTTAYVAEQWGRRWIAIDTSRVAVALARQRLLTGAFDYYKLKDESKGIIGGFVNKQAPHITLKSIAQNTALDPIFAKHEPILKEKLDALNNNLSQITPPPLRIKLLAKLKHKQKKHGKTAITDADKRRWQLPDTHWHDWQVPFDTDPDWPKPLQHALVDYRKAWQAKMNDVNACITAASETEELVDQPHIDRKRVRVTGPFTVEAVQPAEESLDLDAPSTAQPEEVKTTFDAETDTHQAVNAEAYLEQMIHHLRHDGVRFTNNNTLKFDTLEPIEADILHAEGTWKHCDTECSVAVAFGPQHGPITAMQVEACLPIASRRGYDELVFAGFSFDGAAQAVIQDDPNPRVRIHMAHINPDVAMGGLLKQTPSTQLFTVFGMPRTTLEEAGEEEYIVKMEGVDIYDPSDNTVRSAGADKVAAWFVDTDYDGRTFCITQAFFPDKTAWKKIARALKGVIDEEQFERFSGTTSFPFCLGPHKQVAVKVIDPRGNEVMSLHSLGDQRY